MTDTQKILSEFDEETLLRLIRMAKREEESQKKKEDANPNFIQVSKQSLPSVSFLAAENGLAAGIYFFLTERMTAHNAVACSYQVFQDYFGASKSSVYSAVKLLKERNFFSIAKMGNTNVYHLNSKIVWQRGNNERKFAEFSATVVLTESEQEKYNIAKKSMIKLNAIKSTGDKQDE